MSDSHWSTIERIFHEASALTPEERATFLKEACGGDDQLRRDVQSLLEQPAQAEFLEEPAINVAAGIVSTASAGLTSERIGVYQVGDLLGRGGMGEVYRARDTRLDREVAIKVLPRAFTNDPDRLARFEREARVLASLNHPHIGMIHGLEESGGARALVLELVEGDTLADRIARGPVPVRQALIWARQIADALDAAHEKGIVHRDLKPANVKITPDEVVKVLDFGLARTYSAEGEADDKRSPSITSDGSVILGTAAYMSPEQARGQSVGKRADVWAFGCVLYELLTGRLAFDQPTVPDTLAAVLHRDPDWTALPPELAGPVAMLLRRCLEKDVKQRRRDMGDVRAELDDALARPSGVTRLGESSVSASGGRLWWMIPAALGVTAGVAAVGLAWWWGTRVEVASPRGARSQQITSLVGMEEMPAVSPKTPEVAFVLTVNGRRQIHRQIVTGGELLPITHDDADHDYPRWTHDSKAIVYFKHPAKEGDSGMLYEVSALGGSAPRRLAAATTGGDVSHDGLRIATFQQTAGGPVLAILDRNSGATTREFRLPVVIAYETPRWSPNDRWIAFAANEGNSREFLFIVDVNGGEPRRLTEATDINGLAWLPDDAGLVYASSSGSTLRYPPVFNLRMVSLAGGPEQQLTVGDVSHVQPDVNTSGQIFASRVRMHSDIWRFPATGKPTDLTGAARITRQTAQVQTPSVRPDGREIAYLSDSGGHSNVWIARLDGSIRPRQLTNEQDPDMWVGLPLWSPAGDRIVYVKSRFGSSSHWIINPDDGSGLRLLVEGSTGAAWSPDGKWLYYQKYSGTRSSIYRIAVDGGEPALVRDDAAMPMVSSDARTLFFSPRTMASVYEIFKASPPDAAPTLIFRYESSRAPMYPTGHVLSPDYRFIAVPLKDGAATNIWAISTEDGSARQLTHFGNQAILIGRHVSWSKDGRSVYAAVVETDADIVLLDGLLPPLARISPGR